MTPQRSKCSACGHEDWTTELYALAGPTGAGWYCRNNKSCHERTKAQYAARRTETKRGTLMQFGTYEEPVNTESDDYKPREHYGNSAVVKVLEYKDKIVTPNSPDGAPGVLADVYDLNEKAAYRNVLMMTGSLVDGFRPHVGKSPIVVKWEKRVANNGRPYACAVPASEGAIKAASDLYAAGDPFAPTLGTIEEEAPF